MLQAVRSALVDALAAMLVVEAMREDGSKDGYVLE